MRLGAVVLCVGSGLIHLCLDG